MAAFASQAGAVMMTPDEFDAQFAGLFEREAFRLEQLDCYDSPGTQERVRRFLAGESDDPALRAGWDALLRQARRAGKTMSRVHVVSEPLSDYLRFELDFYRGSVAAGEDVRILPRARALGLDLPGYDFWLFDQSAAVMVYDQAGSWQRAALLTSPGFEGPAGARSGQRRCAPRVMRSRSPSVAGQARQAPISAGRAPAACYQPRAIIRYHCLGVR